ncbi:FAD-dependent oxidoreductase [Actinomycetospora endophytica]|uniref:FAD-dependent oxidoreductase n=1 Tax=Actinomycetospora endophytica TaxID=2291215 RepID=A0ABS8PHI8_9PSEU|nr:FAD-dependent oxidoreductase [Actinomycetospora endophytica]MCD2197503.1 FAD-dependent oxidoreductase [Actinomycetospora endophytica]
MTATPDHDVLVSGGGPVGLMVAAELALAGVDVAVIERRTEPDTTIKAGAIVRSAVHALDRRGLLDAALAVQQRVMAEFTRAAPRRSGPPTGGHIAAFPLRLDLLDVPEDGPDDGPMPFMVVIPQHELETILRDRVAELGVPVHRGVDVVGIEPDDAGVTVGLSDGGPRRAAWLVGADGGRSVVRQAAGIGFPGTDPEITGRQALVELADADDLEGGWHHGPDGVWCLGPAPGRILTVEFDGPPADRDAPVSAEELEKSLRRVTGSRARVTAVHSATRWTDNARQASAYRAGRVLLAGDAAHVHPPFGGQGLGLVLSDAMNLGWKLAEVVHGTSGEELLDTYDPERRPAGEAVLELTRAQVALMRPDPKTLALRRYAADLLNTHVGVNAAAALLAGPDVHAPIAGSDDDPLIGRLAPEVRLDDGRRLAEVARDGRFTLVTDGTVAGPGDGRTTTVRASGVRPMLVRPDGVVSRCAPRS